MEKLRADVISTKKIGLLDAGIFNSPEDSKLTVITEKDKMTVGVGQNYVAKVKFYENYENMGIIAKTTPVFLHYSMIEAATMKNG